MTTFESSMQEIKQLEAAQHLQNIETAITKINAYYDEQIKLELAARIQYALSLTN
jgi:hypothetical protein